MFNYKHKKKKYLKKIIFFNGNPLTIYLSVEFGLRYDHQLINIKQIN